MVRKQVYIEPDQDALLKRRATQLGVSEAELIRRGIEAVGRAPATWLRPDVRAWDAARSVIEQRMRLPVPQTGRAWSRDELYDERLRRPAP
jgi:hypothetical protein